MQAGIDEEEDASRADQSGEIRLPPTLERVGPVPERCEIAIVGGGVIGLSIAYQLARLGLTDVVVLERGYLAFVWGVPERPRGMIDKPLGRHRQTRERMTVRADGRAAITHYEVLERFAGSDGEPVASLIACRALLPNAGALVIDCGSAKAADGKNYWFIFCPIIQEPNAKPRKR